MILSSTIPFDVENVKEVVSDINSNLYFPIDTLLKHGLHINPKKTAVLRFGRSKTRATVMNDIKTKIYDEVIALSNSARDLGLHLDTKLRFK